MWLRQRSILARQLGSRLLTLVSILDFRLTCASRLVKGSKFGLLPSIKIWGRTAACWSETLAYDRVTIDGAPGKQKQSQIKFKGRLASLSMEINKLELCRSPPLRLSRTDHRNRSVKHKARAFSLDNKLNRRMTISYVIIWHIKSVWPAMRERNWSGLPRSAWAAGWSPRDGLKEGKYESQFPIGWTGWRWPIKMIPVTTTWAYFHKKSNQKRMFQRILVVINTFILNYIYKGNCMIGNTTDDTKKPSLVYYLFAKVYKWLSFADPCNSRCHRSTAL